MNRIPIQNGHVPQTVAQQPKLKQFRAEIVFSKPIQDPQGVPQGGAVMELGAFSLQHAVNAIVVNSWTMPIRRLTIEAVEPAILTP